MHPVIAKTFGGLPSQAYIRHLLLCLPFPSLMLVWSSRAPAGVPAAFVLYLIASTLLYPYSRFTYTTVVDFVVGSNEFSVSIFLALFFKTMTMGLCWALAIAFAPMGLLFLYLRHQAELRRPIHVITYDRRARGQE
jgi:hypothetical protein